MKTYYFDNENDRESIVLLLQKGNILAGNTDTVPGLFGILSYEVFTDLNGLKKREHKPYLILISDVHKLSLFVENEIIQRITPITLLFWPGPLTIIVPAKRQIPSFLVNTHGNIALRVPRHPFLLEVLAHFTGLFSTSANEGGAAAPTAIADIAPAITTHIAALIVDREQRTSSKSSTLLDCTEALPRIIREGAVTRDMLRFAGIECR